MAAKRTTIIITSAGALALVAVVCLIAVGPRAPKSLMVEGKSIEAWSLEANGGGFRRCHTEGMRAFKQVNDEVTLTL